MNFNHHTCLLHLHVLEFKTQCISIELTLQCAQDYNKTPKKTKGFWSVLHLPLSSHYAHNGDLNKENDPVIMS